MDLGFWTVGDTAYTVDVYDGFDGTNLGNLLKSGSGTSEGSWGEIEIELDVAESAGIFAVRIGTANNSYPVYTGEGIVESDVSYYYTGEAWADLYSEFGWVDFSTGVGKSANFAMGATTSMGGEPDLDIWVNDTRGNWSIEDEEFVSPNTLAVDIKANDYGPFDAEIGVQGGMNPIFLDGRIFNDTGEDWPGIVLQLGYGLGDDFELATNGLFFTDGTNFFNELVDDGTVRNGVWESFDQPIPVVLPQGASDPFFFTMRVYAVPEPGSLLLLGLASLVLLAFGRPRR